MHWCILDLLVSQYTSRSPLSLSISGFACISFTASFVVIIPSTPGVRSRHAFGNCFYCSVLQLHIEFHLLRCFQHAGVAQTETRDILNIQIIQVCSVLLGISNFFCFFHRCPDPRFISPIRNIYILLCFLLSLTNPIVFTRISYHSYDHLSIDEL